MAGENTPRNRPLRFVVVAIVAVLFGLVTIIKGGQVLFGADEARAAAGNYVPFILWFNFIAGFFYIAAGVGLWFRQFWAARLSMIIAIATMAAFSALGIHILMDGAFEFRTLAAMILRSFIWIAIAFTACRTMQAAKVEA